MSKKNYAVVLHPTGPATDATPANGETFTLEEAQKIVGGFIEIVHLNEDLIMIVDEDGKCKELPVNLGATAIAKSRNAIMPYDHIVGDVILCPSEMLP